MTERAMATIRRIDNIEPIEGADKIVKATVGGWQLVTAIDNGFKVGDFVIYCEIDSWIPTEVAPFLTKGKEPREFNGIKGEKLRTIKLRGQVSQGLLLPTSILPESVIGFEEGSDVSEFLGIIKYEPPISPQMAGVMKGNFPSKIPKTDQERIQNLTKEFPTIQTQTFEVTEKLEGSSMTVYLIDGEFGVCSRNVDLKRDENNTFWKTALELDLETKLRGEGKNIAIQGELVGPGIQDNIYRLTKHAFYLFDVFYVDEFKYLHPTDRRAFAAELDIPHVPVLIKNFTIGPNDTVFDIVKMADGVSVMTNVGQPVNREGLVYKSYETEFSFKAISNLYLSKQRD